MPNSLQNDRTFDWNKLKAFLIDNLIVNQMTKSVLDGLDNIVENGGNAFFFPPEMCPKGLFFSRSLKFGIVW